MEKIGFVNYKVFIFMLLSVFFSQEILAINHESNVSATKMEAIPSVLINSEDTLKGKVKKKATKSEKLDKAQVKGKISFETFEKNLEKAFLYYDKKHYLSAARLFEELYPLSMGTQYADTILFTFADCYFQNKDYEMAAFHFKDYTRRYPGTEKTEEAYFKCVQAIYELSPYYSLDQFETTYAIEEIDLFIQMFPKNKFVPQCNDMLDELRDKLAKKDFEVLKLYYNTENYKAAQIAIKNFMKEFSYSKYAPESLYILVRNNLKYAKKSVPAKQLERYQSCVDAFESLQINFPDSPFIAMAEPYMKEAKQLIAKQKSK